MQSIATCSEQISCSLCSVYWPNETERHKREMNENYWKMLACITVFFFRVYLVFFLFYGAGWGTIFDFIQWCCCCFCEHSAQIVAGFSVVLPSFWLKGNWNWLFWCTINAWEWSVMGLYCEFQLFMRWKFGWYHVFCLFTSWAYFAQRTSEFVIITLFMICFRVLSVGNTL